MTTPVITKPMKSGFSLMNNQWSNTPVCSSPFSPVSFFRPSLQPTSPPIRPDSYVPRPPVVHFFICDHGNAKVKGVSDQFVDLLMQNGIRVFCERYATHQPGFQVRAASMNTNADFFFQIHSKTAGPGHVRMYFNGQPKRMSLEEAVSDIWAWWRLMSGAISKEEAECLSDEKVRYALSTFSSITEENMPMDALVTEIRASIANGKVFPSLLDKIRIFEETLNDGKLQLTTFKTMSLDWVKEPGTQLSRCLQMPIVRGISPYLKDYLSSIIDRYLLKIQALKNIIMLCPSISPQPSPEPQKITQNDMVAGQAKDNLSWDVILDNVGDDDYHGSHYGSYGDGYMGNDESMPPSFYLEEF